MIQVVLTVVATLLGVALAFRTRRHLFELRRTKLLSKVRIGPISSEMQALTEEAQMNSIAIVEIMNLNVDMNEQQLTQELAYSNVKKIRKLVHRNREISTLLRKEMADGTRKD